MNNKTLGSEKEQEVFMTDIPLMTAHGTFIINGVERVIVPQLARSFGVFFPELEIRGKQFWRKIIPARGVWIEIESDIDGGLYVRIDKKRKFPVTALLRVFGLSTDDMILEAFKDSAYLETIKTFVEKIQLSQYMMPISKSTNVFVMATLLLRKMRKDLSIISSAKNDMTFLLLDVSVSTSALRKVWMKRNSNDEPSQKMILSVSLSIFCI